MTYEHIFPILHDRQSKHVNILGISSCDETITRLGVGELITAGINTSNGISNALDSKLNNIIDAWIAENSENRNDVLNKIDAFINQVEAQRGNQIAEVDAHALIGAAEEIILLILEI